MLVRYSFFFLLVLITATMRGQDSLVFSGITWEVKEGYGGPGPNYWSPGPDQVWVDEEGMLHLKILEKDGFWYCSEIYSRKSFGYGTYAIELLSDPEQLDDWAVLGFFTYQDDDHEIDIEFARWGQANNPFAWFTVQPPPYTSGNQVGFSPGLGNNSSVHSFYWSSDSILFKSTRQPQDSLVFEWLYQGERIPPPGQERLHINFWLFQSHPPTLPGPGEVVIKSVKVPGKPSVITTQPFKRDLMLFPNPAKDKVRLLFPGAGERKVIQLINSSGVLMEELSTRESAIDVKTQHWPPGLYLFSVESGGSRMNKRLIIR